jgi:hypothetical protein
VDYFRFARRNFEWAYLLACFYAIEEESQRYDALRNTPSILFNDGSEALAASSVKIHGRDVLATWKILISLGVAPVLYSFYAAVTTILAVKTNAPLKWRLLAPALTITALPVFGYAALKFGEAGMDVLKWFRTVYGFIWIYATELLFRSLRPLILSLMPGQQQYLERLRAMQQSLSNELMDVINEFGPKIYDDFDKACGFLVAQDPSWLYCRSRTEFYSLRPAFLCRVEGQGFGKGRAVLPQ